MKVAVNALGLPSFRQGGAGFYSATLVDGLSRHPAVEQVAVVSQDLAAELPQLAPAASATADVRRPTALPKPAKALNYLLAGRRPAALDLGYEGRELPPLDVVHWPISFMHAPGPPPGAATVLTVLDLQHEFFPQFFSRRDRVLRRLRWRPSAQAADHVIGISEFTVRTVAERYGVREERLTVIPLCCRQSFLQASPEGPPVDGEPIDVPYFLYPAAPLPAKNHARLLDALVLHRSRGSKAQLILTGPRMHDWSRVEQAVADRGLDGAVVRLGHVDDDQLRGLYARAAGLVFPSLFEGFGLPVLEAMAVGCPVAASTAGSLPEVVGDAGRQFEPEDVDAIADAFAWLEGLDSADREALASRAGNRAAIFTPEHMIERTLSVYQQVAA